MKTRLKLHHAFILVILLSTQWAAAQSKVGLRAGVVISKQDFQDGQPIGEYKSKLGADLALVADFPIGPIFSISPEFHWMQKGAKIEDLQGTPGEISRTFNYLEIPVLFKLNFGEGAGFFLLAGPSFGYLLDGSDKDGDGSTSDIDLDFYKRGELGGHIGGGIGLGPIKVDVRYIFGLTNIWDNDGTEDVEISNSGFGAGVTFMF